MLVDTDFGKCPYSKCINEGTYNGVFQKEVLPHCSGPLYALPVSNNTINATLNISEHCRKNPMHLSGSPTSSTAVEMPSEGGN